MNGRRDRFGEELAEPAVPARRGELYIIDVTWIEGTEVFAARRDTPNRDEIQRLINELKERHDGRQDLRIDVSVVDERGAHRTLDTERPPGPTRHRELARAAATALKNRARPDDDNEPF